MMTREQAEGAVSQAIANACCTVCEGVEINCSASLEHDLGLDTMDKVMIIMELEGIIGQIIPEEACDKFETIGDIVNYLTSQKE